MNAKEKATEVVKDTLAQHCDFNKVPASVIESSLSQSLIPDSRGNFPGSTGYVETYDPYYCVYLVIQFLDSAPMLTSASSEGTTINMQRGDSSKLVAWLRRVSPVLSASSPILQCVEIPCNYGLSKVNMGGDSDVDTDVG